MSNMLADARALAKYEHVDEALEEIKKLDLESFKVSNEKDIEEDCDGKANCEKREVRVVRGEQGLIRLMNEGWDLIKELSNDRFVLKKDFD